MEIELNEQNFEQEVLKSDIPVLVDFWATWCGPCRMIAPIVEEIAKEYEGKIKVGKVNVDEAEGLAALYRVMNIPTLMVFKDGKVSNIAIGYKSKAEIVRMF